MDNLTHSENFKIPVTFNYDTGILFSFFSTLLVAFFSLSIFYYIHKSFETIKICVSYIIDNSFIFILYVYAGIIAQEIIKSLILKLFAGVKFKEQKTGFNFSSLMPYVKSKYPVNIRSYLLLLIIPNVINVILLFLSVILNMALILILTFVWLFFSGYDILTLIKLRRFYNKRYLVNESDNLPGVFLYENPF